MLSLAATFEKDNGRQHSWRMKNADPNKTAEEIKTALEKLTTLDLFEKDGVRLFEKVVSAKFVETIETLIFDKKTEAQSEDKTEEKPQALMPAVNKQSPLQMIEDPQALIIEQELIKPDMLKQVFALPAGIEPAQLSETEARSLVLAIMPKRGSLEEISIVEGTQPVRFKLLVKLEDEYAVPKRAASPPKEKKRRGRLIERLKRRRE